MMRRILSTIVLAIALLAGPASAQWFGGGWASGGGSSGGGAATSITNNVTTCVSGAVGRLVYTAAGLAVKCDATSPQWDPATGTFTGTRYVATGAGTSSVPTLGLHDWSFYQAGANDLDIFNAVSDPLDNGGFVLEETAAATSFSSYSPDGSNGIQLSALNTGVSFISAFGELGLSSESVVPAQWKVSGGHLTSVGAGRNLTASGTVAAPTFSGGVGADYKIAVDSALSPGFADVEMYHDGNATVSDFYQPGNAFTEPYYETRINGSGTAGTHLYDIPNTVSFEGLGSAGYIIFSKYALRFGSGGEGIANERWSMTSANGSFLAATDGGPDIGASGANRPNNGYFKTDVIINGASVVTGLAGKATDSLVAHLAGTESITGQKTFSLLPNLPTQSANTVYAGPSSGGSAVPTFRALASADIPNNAANTTGSAASLSGRFVATGTALSGSNISGCGSGASITGVDGAFRLTAGTLTVGLSGCTVTFANGAFAHAPVCHATEETTLAIVRASPTTTTVVLNGTSALTGDAVGVTCTGF